MSSVSQKNRRAFPQKDVPAQMPPSDALLSNAEMAVELKISKRTLGRWRGQQIIPFFRVGRMIRYDRAKVMRALEAYEVGGVQQGKNGVRGRSERLAA